MLPLVQSRPSAALNFEKLGAFPIALAVLYLVVFVVKQSLYYI